MKRTIISLAVGLGLGFAALSIAKSDQSEEFDLRDWCFVQCVADGAGNLSGCMSRCMREGQSSERMREDYLRANPLRLHPLPFPKEFCEPCGEEWPDGCNWYCNKKESGQRR